MLTSNVQLLHDTDLKNKSMLDIGCPTTGCQTTSGFYVGHRWTLDVQPQDAKPYRDFMLDIGCPTITLTLKNALR